MGFPAHPIFSGSTFGLMSGENPYFQPQVEGGHEALGQMLQQMGLHHEPTSGKYGQPERSYIVHNPTAEQMQHLGKLFGQESVVHSQNGQHRLIYTNGEHEGKYNKAHLQNPLEHFEQPPSDYYTTVPGHGHARINFDFDTKHDLDPVAKAEREFDPAFAAFLMKHAMGNLLAEQAPARPHPHSYEWHDGHNTHHQHDHAGPQLPGLAKAGIHPHMDAPPANPQAAPVGVDTYKQYALPYGDVRPGSKPDLLHYNYHDKLPEIEALVHDHGYKTYYAGGKYGKPDLANKNYNTGHLMVYDPSPQSGASFGHEKYTNAWRQIHELSHALTLPELNRIYGEGRRMGKLGTHRTTHEALRAVHWEWLAAHKQRELSKQIGVPIKDEDFHRELNTVMHDAAHRAVTGKFTEPSGEGFNPHKHKVPLHTALQMVRDAGHKMGLEGLHYRLPKPGFEMRKAEGDPPAPPPAKKPRLPRQQHARFETSITTGRGPQAIKAAAVGGGLSLHRSHPANMKPDRPNDEPTYGAWTLTHEPTGQAVAHHNDFDQLNVLRDALLDQADWTQDANGIREQVKAKPHIKDLISQLSMRKIVKSEFWDAIFPQTEGDTPVADEKLYTPEEAREILIKATREKVSAYAKEIEALQVRELKKALIPNHKHNQASQASAGIEDVPPGKVNPKGVDKMEKQMPPPAPSAKPVAPPPRPVPSAVQKSVPLDASGTGSSPVSMGKAELCKKCGKSHDMKKGCEMEKAVDKMVVHGEKSPAPAPKGADYDVKKEKGKAVFEAKKSELVDAKGKRSDNHTNPDSTTPDDKKSAHVNKPGKSSKTAGSGGVIKPGKSLEKAITTETAPGEGVSAPRVQTPKDASSHKMQTQLQGGLNSRHQAAMGHVGKLRQDARLHANMPANAAVLTQHADRQEAEAKAKYTRALQGQGQIAKAAGPASPPTAKPPSGAMGGVPTSAPKAPSMKVPTMKAELDKATPALHARMAQETGMAKPKPQYAKPPTGSTSTTPTLGARMARETGMKKEGLEKGVFSDAAKQADPVSAAHAAKTNIAAPKVKLPTPTQHEDRAATFQAAAGGAFAPPAPAPAAPKPALGLKSPKAAGVTRSAGPVQNAARPVKPGIFGKLFGKGEDRPEVVPQNSPEDKKFRADNKAATAAGKKGIPTKPGDGIAKAGSVPDEHKAKIAGQDAKMPKPMKDVMSPKAPDKATQTLFEDPEPKVLHPSDKKSKK